MKTICIIHVVVLIVEVRCFLFFDKPWPIGHVLLAGLLLNFKCLYCTGHSPNNLLHRVSLYHTINTFLTSILIKCVFSITVYLLNTFKLYSMATVF